MSRPSGVRDGCVRLTEMIADEHVPLVVSSGCAWTIEAFSSLRPDRNSPEIYDDNSDYAHVMDACRYLVVGLRGGRPTSVVTGPSTVGRGIFVGPGRRRLRLEL